MTRRVGRPPTRSAVEAGERGLSERERAGLLIELGVERATELDQDLGHTLGHAPRQLGHLVRGRLG
ncbi:MAG: hypothetical protein HY744_34195 [Deltaproteobacteria bacterium]|nr:hypothetical protein [Deltaproteobacteria bacterium]